jgi:hypothetical protein
VDEVRIPVSGDPFYAASLGDYSHTPDEESPHGCIDGWVYIGCEGEDENGEHVEEIERVPCRRCNVGDL